MPSAISAQMHRRYPIGHLSNSLRYNFRSDLVPWWQNERRAAIAVQFDLTLFVHLAKKLPKVNVLFLQPVQFFSSAVAILPGDVQSNNKICSRKPILGSSTRPHTVADPKQWHSPLG